MNVDHTRYVRRVFGCVIVALGGFVPSQINPQWLSNHKLIGDDDLDDWIKDDESNSVGLRKKAIYTLRTSIIDVEPIKLTVSSQEAQNLPTRDLASSILILLGDAPVNAIGINFVAHYFIPNEDDRHAVGDALAPKELWTKAFPAADNNESSYGMLNLQISIDPVRRAEIAKRKTKDQRNLAVQHSGKIQQGIYFDFNRHIDLVGRKSATAAEAGRIIVEEFEETELEAMRGFETILSSILPDSDGKKAKL